VDSAYLLGARLVDRRLNTVLSSVIFSTASSDISVSPAGIVRGLAVGRAKIAIQMGSRSDSAFTSVVPLATLALRDYSGVIDDSTGYAEMNLDGSGYRRLFNTDVLPHEYAPSNKLAPQWIPGTGRLVHLRTVDGVTRLFVGDTTGVAAQRLIEAPGEITAEADPDVSADGAWVYFVGHSANGDGLWRVATSGGVPERITAVTPLLQLRTPSVSPDGNKVVYAMARSGVLLQAYVHDLVTGDTMRLSDNQAAGTRWSPAGDWILYTVSYPHEGYSGPLRLIRPDGSEDHELSGDAYFWGGSWSPDGTYLVVMRAGPPSHAELINVSTGLRLPLTYERTWFGPAWRR
jgi:Tol biopolymer transport system component